MLALVIGLVAAWPATAPDSAPVAGALPASRADDATCQAIFDDCRSLLVAGIYHRAAGCFGGFAGICPDHPLAPTATAMADVAETLAIHPPADESAGTGRRRPRRRADADTGGSELDALFRELIPTQRLLWSGVPELLLTSTIFGARTGYLSLAALYSAQRTPRSDSFFQLLAVPALGAVAGFAGSGAAMVWGAPSVGDMALVSSAMWVGTAHGLLLGRLAETVGHDVGLRLPERTAGRFAAELTTGSVATLAAIGVAPFLDIDPGDIGLMNSAALWGGVLSSLALASSPAAARGDIRPTLVPLAGSLLAYDAALALSPVLHVARPTTWLIDGGGAAGVLVGLVARQLLQQLVDYRGVDPADAALFASTALGLTMGTAACFIVDSSVEAYQRKLLGPAPPRLTLWLSDESARPGQQPLLGVAVSGRF